MPDRNTCAADGLAELALADPAWVRAEFDAIVAANFGSPPPPPPGAVEGGRGRPELPVYRDDARPRRL